MSIYADTSFLLSLYALDANSEIAVGHVRKAKLPILVTPLGELELANAISLRLFRRETVSGEAKASRAAIEQDLAAGVLLKKPFTIGIFDRAIQISRRRTTVLGMRTLDILHVAAAIELKAEAFLTFDRRQEELANHEGLTTGAR